MIGGLIAKFVMRLAVKKFLRDVQAHVKAGGWNQKGAEGKPSRNFRGRFEPEVPATPRDNIGEKTMSADQISGFVRHLLTFAGGWAVTQGWMDESMVMETVGAVATLFGVVWSYWAKR